MSASVRNAWCGLAGVLPSKAVKTILSDSGLSRDTVLERGDFESSLDVAN